MQMFCNQCQETAKNTGCTVRGMCGKSDETANLQDLLIYVLQGISLKTEAGTLPVTQETGVFLCQALFATITNANFDTEKIVQLIKKGIKLRNAVPCNSSESDYDAVLWNPVSDSEFAEKAQNIGILNYSENEDIRSLKTLMLYGMKGIAAYTDHASVLGFYNEDIFTFMVKGLAALSRDLSADVLTALVLETGETAVKAMALLDEANTSKYGNPEITKVDTGVRSNPGILVSGHDLRDMEELLKQTDGTGIDVYTHSEMLPAHYYPAFKKYRHFAGNYGGSWWKQTSDFESFNGPILMTTNCIVPVRESYKDRIFTTGMAGYPGVTHIEDRQKDGQKDFSTIIQLAKKCSPPKEIETGQIVGGFAHNQVLALADKVIDAVKSGAIKRFIVMAGCDGRHASRQYFTDVAESLPKTL